MQNTPSVQSPGRPGFLPVLILTLLPALLLVAALFFLLDDSWGSAEVLEFARGVTQKHRTLAILAFVCIYTLLQVIMAPSAPMIVGASLLFGFWHGLAVVLISMTCAMVVIHMVSNTIIGRWILPLLERNRHFLRASQNLRKGGGFMIFLMRINPIFAFSMVSYLAGALRLPLLQVLLWSLPGLILPVSGWLWVAKLTQGIKEVPVWFSDFSWRMGLILLVVLALWIWRSRRKSH